MLFFKIDPYWIDEDGHFKINWMAVYILLYKVKSYSAVFDILSDFFTF